MRLLGARVQNTVNGLERCSRHALQVPPTLLHAHHAESQDNLRLSSAMDIGPLGFGFEMEEQVGLGAWMAGW